MGGSGEVGKEESSECGGCSRVGRNQGKIIEEVLIFRFFVGELGEVEKEVGNTGGMMVEGDLIKLSNC